MGLTHRPQVDPDKLAALYAAAGLSAPEEKAGPRHQPGATRNLPDAALTAPARRRADERVADPRAAGRGDRAGVAARSAAATVGGHGPAVAAPAVVPVPPMGPAKAITEGQAPATNPTTGAVRVEFRTGNHGKGEALYRDGSKFDGDGWHEGAPWAPPSLTAGPASSTGSDAKNAAEALAAARSRGRLEPGDVPEQGVNGARLLGFHADPDRPGGAYATYDDGSTFDTGGWHAPGVQVPSPDGAGTRADAQVRTGTRADAPATKETGMDPLDALGDVCAPLADESVPALDLTDLDVTLEGLEVESKYDTSPVGKPGGRQNWVDQEGGLPAFVRAIVHALKRDGKSTEQAIQIAWGTVRRWAAGGGDVTPATRAKAAAAVAKLERMRAAARAKPNKGLDDALDLERKDGWENGAQGAPSGISYKEVPVESVVDVDEERGIVTAIVSVTGLRDRVGDIIEPGAYTKTLQARKPKGVWSHSWEQPISKTLEIRELMPGDPQLPKQIRGGEPWPREAGALLVKTQFNLLGDRGRQAFADVVFFAEDQEWSIGYNVPAGGAKHEAKAGLPTRRIRELDLYEYSPVLFGAMPAAATVSVKSAQHAFRSAMAALDNDELSRFQSLRDELEGKAFDPQAGVAPDRPAADLAVGDEVTFLRAGDSGPEQVSGVVTMAPERRGDEGRAVDFEVDDDPVSLLATEPVRVTGRAEVSGAEEKADPWHVLYPEQSAVAEVKARRGGRPTGGWQRCSNCGSTDRDEFADGTARCENCGTELVHATTGSGAKTLLVALAEQLGLGDQVAQEIKALLEDPHPGYVDDDAAGYVPTSPIEVKAEPAPARLSEIEVLMARRAALSAD